ncbi:uncharacterized protein MONOS_10058 [Monocercomonoides exilis]|uniref:uncharacterized protein n=1 Tax=Monocercomonoides exilis TaxID=2049356 RepID=UPI003559B604|nr:hypothetical protein MONOS_10058 [Monocercomonoides exilis]|eukprot:MONOS_10058.1-p1 / transcript=MONOS_10058.1 / gene=MONOS_10058 / organism=Monocercomonoides_exilis_PA203 / gene_product=unspecified product / transcript_product=unspecified product / location=Mono_scaffold00440:48205-48711(-) / protein_length=169 / sequence_SO=supercontig / SO=protein_coding / is_pseudo=false
MQILYCSEAYTESTGKPTAVTSTATPVHLPRQEFFSRFMGSLMCPSTTISPSSSSSSSSSSVHNASIPFSKLPSSRPVFSVKAAPTQTPLSFDSMLANANLPVQSQLSEKTEVDTFSISSSSSSAAPIAPSSSSSSFSSPSPSVSFSFSFSFSTSSSSSLSSCITQKS